MLLAVFKAAYSMFSLSATGQRQAVGPPRSALVVQWLEVERATLEICALNIETDMSLGRNNHVLRCQQISMKVHMASSTVRLPHVHSNDEAMVARVLQFLSLVKCSLMPTTASQVSVAGMALKI